MKKIKGYLPLHLVRWIQDTAKKEGVKPSVVIQRVMAKNVFKPVKEPKRLKEWSSQIPGIRMEMSFCADDSLLTKWERYKELNGITCDCQTVKLILKKEYERVQKKNSKQREICFKD